MRVLCLGALLTCSAVSLHADGMFMGPEVLGERASGRAGVASTEQKGVIIQLPEGREALLLQTTYHGPAGKFAWVIPVPGRPAKEDVFLAEPAFIEELLEQTAPEVRTTITGPPASGGEKMGEAMEAGASAPGVPPSPEAVTVHERMKVGKFDATVLSATGAQVLTDWLHENGYQVPDDSADILGHYVQQQWYFVALKMQPAEAEARPILDDVDPIGIRFATDKLVYPLYISRASSRQKTAMTLLLLSQQPLQCDQLPEGKLPFGKEYRRGSCYAAIRRQVVDSAAPALVSEYRGPGGLLNPNPYYGEDASGPREGRDWSAKRLWTTRYWTLLDREEMEDLTFSPSADQRTMRLVVSRVGRVHVPLSQRIAVAPVGAPWLWAVAGLLVWSLFAWLSDHGFRWRPGGATLGVVAVTGLALAFMVTGPAGAALGLVAVPACIVALALRNPSADTTPGDQVTRTAKVRDALIAAGVGGFGYIALRVLGGDPHFEHTEFGQRLEALYRGEAGLLSTLLAIVGPVGWIALVVHQVVQGCRAAGPRWLWIAVPFVGLVAGMSAIEVHRELFSDALEWLKPSHVPLGALAVLGWVVLAASLAALLALMLLVSYLMVSPWVSPGEARRSQPLALTFVGLILLGAFASVSRTVTAFAGTGGYVSTGTHRLDMALEQLDIMMTDFHDSYGCYPKELQDLIASSRPTAAVDSSGNRVEVAPAASAPPHPGMGSELPVDPLTGRRDTWVYEPTGSPMVDSGGFRIELLQVEAMAARDG